MTNHQHPAKKIFTYTEAGALLPEVRRITEAAYQRVESLRARPGDDVPSGAQDVLADWAQSLLDLGVEVKGIWLVDFDNGSGYYCWRHPEAGLHYYHSYEEGFGGRVPIQ